MIDVERWELAQLGDGAASEGVALLFESLAGQPEWLRATTQLRGEPLDDVVHTEATRRLLAVRRAAAMVLFEIKRRDGVQAAETQGALYRGLLRRALYCVLSDDDAGRWALEADVFASGVVPLLGGLLAAQLEGTLSPSWWTAPRPALKQIWAGGRSMGAFEAARTLGLAQLDPAALATIGDALRTAADLQLDALSLRRVLDGIADEVLERPAQPEGIAADPERPAGAQLHPHPPRGSRGTLRVDDLPGDRAEVHRLVLGFDSARFEAGQ